jgi:hypothetical protein
LLSRTESNGADAPTSTDLLSRTESNGADPPTSADLLSRTESNRRVPPTPTDLLSNTEYNGAERQGTGSIHRTTVHPATLVRERCAHRMPVGADVISHGCMGRSGEIGGGPPAAAGRSA